MVGRQEHTKWTKSRVAELTRLWNFGDTASDIAKQMNLSRNAVIGKAHRLGLKPRPNPVTPKRPTEQGRKMKGAARNHLKFGHKGQVKKTGSRNIEIDGNIQGPGKTLMELEANECRWPCGDVYCSAKVESGVYCEYHKKIAYVPRKVEDDE